MHQIKLDKVQASFVLVWRQPNEACTWASFFSLMVHECHFQVLCVCTCMFMNARIVYLLISNRLVIIRLSGTAAIGIMYKTCDIFLHQWQPFNVYAWENLPMQRWQTVGYRSSCILLCGSISHFENGLSDCIVCILTLLSIHFVSRTILYKLERNIFSESLNAFSYGSATLL